MTATLHPPTAPPRTPNTQHRAEQIADILIVLQRRLLMDITARVSATKISIPQFTLLGFLSSNESLNMGQLAELMGHTTPATTGLVDRLVQSELVERCSVPNDRRQVLVRITPKGRGIVEDMRAEMVKNVSNVLDRLKPQDGEAWLRIYQTVQQYCHETRHD